MSGSDVNAASSAPANPASTESPNVNHEEKKHKKHGKKRHKSSSVDKGKDNGVKVTSPREQGSGRASSARASTSAKGSPPNAGASKSSSREKFDGSHSHSVNASFGGVRRVQQLVSWDDASTLLIAASKLRVAAINRHLEFTGIAWSAALKDTFSAALSLI
ncbi:hypothetical protein HPB50_014418 [Hyalomma asiaticum]|uniref:Uncharacterized protein n=1 Tax=Hyalomma asiaticum TaxID=266040 RepID=A0ACB7RM31_HYAAI|nr:hypothetical protein HPB50_014418 [Hyalomma asiaticum]